MRLWQLYSTVWCLDKSTLWSFFLNMLCIFTLRQAPVNSIYTSISFYAIPFPSPLPPQTIIHQDSNWNHINLHTNFGRVDTILSFLWYCVKVAQSCLSLCDSMVYTVHGILQARILEWVAFPFSRGSSQPRDRTQVSHIAGRFFTSWTTRGVFSIKIIPMKCRVLIAILKGLINSPSISKSYC